jgi:hypothetical protein
MFGFAKNLLKNASKDRDVSNSGGGLMDMFGGGIGSAISSPSRGYDTSFSDSGMDGGIAGGGGFFGALNNLAKKAIQSNPYQSNPYGLNRGTYDFGGGFTPYMDSIDQANAVGRRVGRYNPNSFNDRDLRTAPRPDAPWSTRMVPEEYEEMEDYKAEDYYNYVRNNEGLRDMFNKSDIAEELYGAAEYDVSGFESADDVPSDLKLRAFGDGRYFEEDKLDKEAFADAAREFGKAQYEADPDKYEMFFVDRQRPVTKERMVEERFRDESARPDREQLFQRARDSIFDRLYSNQSQRGMQYSPYNFDSYMPNTRRPMYRGPLNMGMESLYGMPSRRTGRVGGGGFGGGRDMIYGGGMQPLGGGFRRGGMFGGMQQQAPFGSMFGGGGMFGGIGRGLGSMFGRSTPGMGGAMDPFMTPRGGRGMFGAMNDIARRGMQANMGGSSEGGLPSGYSYEAPKDRMYTMDMPKNGGRWAYGPEGDRIEVGGKPSGNYVTNRGGGSYVDMDTGMQYESGTGPRSGSSDMTPEQMRSLLKKGKSGPFGLSFLKNLFG